ncbi:tail fiber assembly protein [Enterobacter cloacae subsp. cloacae]|uniref:tail fiber assembly protein n=1 Tax=Enterobacter cloacae TaxID=550 RepID=UPI002182C8FF|nr:tail fiber assembly protein [Enterobacter cloacae]MCT2768138.1 tail fiber assembly protein [Enterobacter cloacae]MCU6309315.1 tail fiber assembly protein [Enterobacter cloacae]WLD31591.1 tail fiber assembly protein [Enterobacter cloacae subsp. cloacae]
MTFKFSDKDRTIRIYNLCADTGEFIGTDDCYIPANTGLPAYSTNIKPPDVPKDKVAVFNETTWELLDDYRNQALFSIKTGEQVFFSNLGALPADVTTIAPDGKYMRWNGEGWEKDAAMERAAAVACAESEKKRLMQEATFAVETLKDAVELGEATENEISMLTALKKYRVYLSRVSPNTAPEIEWPELPV